jgi:nucleoside-diphosphate-sugar epimerase
MSAKKKVLITGATGFIGNYVVRELLNRGCEVIASSSDKSKAEGFSWFNEVIYVPLDLADLDPGIDYYHFFGKPDCLVHLAWEGLPDYKANFHVEINLPRHRAFLFNIIKNGLDDLTVTGTCLEYGMQEGQLKEDMPVFPDNAYARAKNGLREMLEGLQDERPFSLKWIRLFYTYGKGQNPNSLLSQLDRAIAENKESFNMSGGQQERDYLPVESVAEYTAIIALQKEVSGIINCGSGNPVRVQEFVEDYLRKRDKSIKLNLGHYPYPDYEPMRFWADVKKLKTILTHE